MAKKKKELMSSAPWRGDDDESDIFEDAKMKITRQPGSDPTLHVPAKKSAKKSGSDYDDDEPVFDPELRYSFQRNMQNHSCFSFDAILPSCATRITPNLFMEPFFPSVLLISPVFWC